MISTDEFTPEQFPGVFCLIMILKLFQKPVDPRFIYSEFCEDGHDLSIMAMVRAFKRHSFKARQVTIKQKRLATATTPFIGICSDGGYFIVGAIKENKALVQHPGKQVCTLSLDELWDKFSGRGIMVTYRGLIPGVTRKFDLGWFVPSVVKYRKLFRDILAASLFLQIFALITPLIFQVVMDKVLVHRVEMTLNVLVIALLATSIFEIILGGLRTYIFSHTTSRIDVELGSQLFRHLLKLPLQFFTARPVGQVVARVRELDNIRDFLTSSALTLMIDLCFSFIFIAIMFFYSSRLAWIVVGSIPCYALVSLLITPSLRQRAEEKFQGNAKNQAFLTESITAIETLKSMAVEPQMRKKWDENLAGYARASFRSSVLGMYGGQTVQLISKIVTVILMWQGALEVMAGHLSVGELIAFNMFSGQIAAPILRLAQLWQDFQQFRISLERLGDVINHPPEPQSGLDKPRQSEIKGEILFDRVDFRYSPLGTQVLKSFDLHIPAGQVLGVVGRSGSGKSTLTRLIQRLYIPESGKVLIDGHNLTLTEPTWLRHQVGVVLQENILFNQTIRENIALARPSASMDQVIQAAVSAGAHDFILELPESYETRLGERGTGLSGGQLQRLAIARALLSDPRILIMDEATSALDYESERILQNNMKDICRNRTVIIIAHRLSTVRRCDRIVVLDEGRIVEEGHHQSLLQQGGIYASLWAAQED